MKSRDETNAYNRIRYQRLKAAGKVRKRTDYQREYKRKWRAKRKETGQ